jgi:large subunit ribosomal protein L17
MRHRVKKIKFKKGKDAIKALLRKLALNFIKYGKIKTTWAKVRSLKNLIERLTSKAKKKKQSTKNVLLKHLGEKKAVDKLSNLIAPKFDDRETGFVRVIKLGKRLGDGAEMGRIEWVKPIILEVQGSRFKVQKKEKQKENAKLNKIDKTVKGKRN